ncbi:MAG: FlgD immunoglobulin-like domain containing protein [Bacteroidota bacterium]
MRYFLLSIFFLVQSLHAQVPQDWLDQGWQWENLGPNRGGRSIAVAGHQDRPNEYYFGATGGGIWKTTSGGSHWAPVSDGHLNSSSVGAIAVAPSNADVVYAGMGEAQLRGNVMQGDGLYKSVDAGTTWQHIGLPETKAISKIVIDPANDDIVYVAALGNPYAPNEERGVFKTTDGGETWDKILFKNEKTGAIDLVLDPSNSQVVYASFWEVYRTPWKLWSGGFGSSLYKSTDGGSSWTELTKNEGLPAGILGKMTLAVSPANSQRVYANIEANKGGLYRSDDGGNTWQLMNDHRDLWQRSFYFMRIEADPIDEDIIYIMNFVLMKSSDGGKTFEYIRTPHADHHQLWIAPNDPKRMIVANDGGGSVSVDGGQHWTTEDFSTAQIYRLFVTEDFPYHACGSQQDNTTVCVASDGGFYHNPREPDGDWMYAVGGGENAYVVTKPGEPDVFYSAYTNGLTRYDRKTGKTTLRNPYPFMVMGEPASDMPERWNWVYPMAFSSAAPHRFYVGSQHLWESEDEGLTWSKISPDLTRAEPKTLGDSGGPIIKDQDGPEIYGTLFTIAPSPHDANTIYTGSDDGLVYLTRNKGKSWKDITPDNLPAHSRIGKIVISKHNQSTVYFAARRYEMDDRSPYLYKSSDYGTTWSKIVSGIVEEDFTHVIAEDPLTKGLLFAGTEHGVYVSFNYGEEWQSFQANLPDTHVSGIEALERELVISTHGRGFWKLGDISALRQMKTVSSNGNHLFEPGKAVRGAYDAKIYYQAASDVDAVSVKIQDDQGQLVRVYNRKNIKAGINSISWDLRYTGAKVFPGIILEGPVPAYGPYAVPGAYSVTLEIEGQEFKKTIEVEKDPRSAEVSHEDLQAQFDLAMEVRDLTSTANQDVIEIREVVPQIEEVIDELTAETLDFAKDISAKLRLLESHLYQVRNQSPKDKIAFPIKLNNRLSGLYAFINVGDQRPPQSMYDMKKQLGLELEVIHGEVQAILGNQLSELNEKLEDQSIEPIKY